MRISGWICWIVVGGLSGCLSVGEAQQDPSVICKDSDRVIYTQKIQRFSAKNNFLPGDLVTSIGEDFIGAPYVPKTLEVQPEKLVVNLRQFDCTTFVETCLSLMRNVKSRDTSFIHFAQNLEKMRYREGKLNGYCSRLHYFSDWIRDNERKGIVKDITPEIGGVPYRISLGFISSHPASYPQLVADTNLISEIRIKEMQVSAQPFYFIPKEKLRSVEDKIKNGDILAITTTVPGLDITHTGIAVKKNGKTFMLNASSVHKKVEITEVSLAEYLAKNASMSGLMVLRPLYE